MRPALECSTCPSSSSTGAESACICVITECPALPQDQVWGGPFPSAPIHWPHVITWLSHALCPALMWLSHTLYPALDLARSPPSISVGWTQLWPRLRPRHRHREAGLQSATSDFLGLRVSPCHHPSATCGQRDFRRPQGPVHTNPKLWLPMAPGLKSSLVMESWGP